MPEIRIEYAYLRDTSKTATIPRVTPKIFSSVGSRASMIETCSVGQLEAPLSVFSDLCSFAIFFRFHLPSVEKLGMT